MSLPEDWRGACLQAEERAWELEREVRRLREAVGALEVEKARRGVVRGLLEGRSELFEDIHRLIGEYRKKMRELAHEKRDIERKYRGLKERVTHTDHSLVQLYSEKVDNLHRLTEKQQREIENTI